MVEWSITTDCKSVTQWVTKVRILLCAPPNKNLVREKRMRFLFERREGFESRSRIPKWSEANEVGEAGSRVLMSVAN